MNSAADLGDLQTNHAYLFTPHDNMKMSNQGQCNVQWEKVGGRLRYTKNKKGLKSYKNNKYNDIFQHFGL